jgi:hypothetical protein
VPLSRPTCGDFDISTPGVQPWPCPPLTALNPAGASTSPPGNTACCLVRGGAHSLQSIASNHTGCSKQPLSFLFLLMRLMALMLLLDLKHGNGEIRCIPTTCPVCEIRCIPTTCPVCEIRCIPTTCPVCEIRCILTTCPVCEIRCIPTTCPVCVAACAAQGIGSPPTHSAIFMSCCSRLIEPPLALYLMAAAFCCPCCSAADL